MLLVLVLYDGADSAFTRLCPRVRREWRITPLDQKGALPLLSCLSSTLTPLHWQYGSFDLRSARYYLSQILSAVAFMHEKGVIHRDLKPEKCALTFSPLLAAELTRA